MTRTYEIDAETAQRVIVNCIAGCECPHEAESRRWQKIADNLYDAARGANRPMGALYAYLDAKRKDSTNG